MEVIAFSWGSVMQELALAHTELQFAQILEGLAGRVCGATSAQFWRYDAAKNRLCRLLPGSNSEEQPVNESTLAGTCALDCEVLASGAEVAIPIKVFGALVGVLTAVEVRPQARPQLEEMAHLAGVIYDGVAQREDVARFNAANQNLLVKAIEALPGVGVGHLGRVARLTGELGTFLDLSSQAKQVLWQAAHYHDVGRLSLADKSEYESERHHPQTGAAFLATNRSLRHLAPLVEAHHERYDGSGFPHGASGDGLPIEAWVLSLAEALEESWSVGQEFDLVLHNFFHEQAEKHHPEVVDALSGLVDAGRLKDILARGASR